MTAAQPDPSRAPASASTTAAIAALPVALDLAGGHGDSVRRWVEGVLGWQPVEARGDALVPPAVRLVDVAARVTPGPARVAPAVLVLTDQDDPAAVAAAGALHTPAAVVTWPADRDRLADVVADVVAAPRPPDATATTALRIGGTGGGVGTTTVALALAGLAAWQGRGALAVVRDRLLAGGIRDVPVEALASPDLWERATPVAGVPGARAVAVARDAPPDVDAIGPPQGVVVVDAGVSPDADVLVARPDAAGLAGAAATTAAAIVVVGNGAASTRALARACGSRRRLLLPWSARVARAGLLGRVPAGLPGAWLRRLSPIVPGRRGVPHHGRTGDEAQ